MGFGVQDYSGRDGARNAGWAFGSDLFSDLTPTRRHSLHLAAAQATSGAAVWLHRVAAATSVDEPLALALETAAMSGASAPSGPGSAQLMEWASDLSADHGGRERRLLTAAVYRVCAGGAGPDDLWTRVRACAPSALRCCALAGRALLECDCLEAEFHLEAARTHADGQHDAVVAISWGLRSELCAKAALGRQAVSAAAAGLAAAAGDRVVERWLTRLLAAGNCYAAGPLAGIDALLGATSAAGQPAAMAAPADPAAILAVGCYRALSGQPREAIECLSPLVVTTGQTSPPDLAVRASQWLALAYHVLGAWDRADEYAAMAIGAADRRGVRGAGAPHALSAQLAAHRGDWIAADGHLRDARDRGGPECPDEAVLCDVAELTIAHARGVLRADHPALIRLATAPAAARKFRSLWLPLNAEALIESGPDAQAATTLADLMTLAEHVPYLRLTACRLTGRLAERRRDPIAARRHYEAAADLPPECLVTPFQLGLLEHCHGRLLCGLGATAEGTVLLDRAGNRLVDAGAISYARRCAADLAARRHAVDDAGEPSVLTERERAVARLVAAGLTNQEVATRLYVSVKTVEYHLAQIYGKLGIRSRRELSRYGPRPAAGAVPRLRRRAC